MTVPSISVPAAITGFEAGPNGPAAPDGGGGTAVGGGGGDGGGAITVGANGRGESQPAASMSEPHTIRTREFMAAS